ncbi:MAG: hypothetical protein COC03_00845 [Robiginitomaculum sp.]|nr:MAG: hypothetical protein COC03_00845 [Robiginitomaculum sp.]
MSKLDNHLSRYKAKTEIDPPRSLEAGIWRNIQAQQSIFSFSALIRPAYQATAVSIGLLIGVLGTGLSSAMVPPDQPMTGLAVFAPDAPHLPSSWLGTTK